MPSFFQGISRKQKNGSPETCPSSALALTPRRAFREEKKNQSLSIGRGELVQPSFSPFFAFSNTLRGTRHWQTNTEKNMIQRICDNRHNKHSLKYLANSPHPTRGTDKNTTVAWTPPALMEHLDGTATHAETKWQCQKMLRTFGVVASVDEGSGSCSDAPFPQEMRPSQGSKELEFVFATGRETRSLGFNRRWPSRRL